MRSIERGDCEGGINRLVNFTTRSPGSAVVDPTTQNHVVLDSRRRRVYWSYGHVRLSSVTKELDCVRTTHRYWNNKRVGVYMNNTPNSEWQRSWGKCVYQYLNDKRVAVYVTAHLNWNNEELIVLTVFDQSVWSFPSHQMKRSSSHDAGNDDVVMNVGDHATQTSDHGHVNPSDEEKNVFCFHYLNGMSFLKLIRERSIQNLSDSYYCYHFICIFQDFWWQLCLILLRWSSWFIAWNIFFVLWRQFLSWHCQRVFPFPTEMRNFARIFFLDGRIVWSTKC